ncbi:uncharacterized protein BJX67DRAFT_219684 [Aspergillus lucknowensis]|uniref:Uncharacterized protein n=1 Tax=Aspergillus lucknowensis TaxID=176173 RepID=A0ABR4LIZ5_9EURO
MSSASPSPSSSSCPPLYVIFLFTLIVLFSWHVCAMIVKTYVHVYANADTGTDAACTLKIYCDQSACCALVGILCATRSIWISGWIEQAWCPALVRRLCSMGLIHKETETAIDKLYISA